MGEMLVRPRHFEMSNSAKIYGKSDGSRSCESCAHSSVRNAVAFVAVWGSERRNCRNTYFDLSCRRKHKLWRTTICCFLEIWYKSLCKCYNNSCSDWLVQSDADCRILLHTFFSIQKSERKVPRRFILSHFFHYLAAKIS